MQGQEKPQTKGLLRRRKGWIGFVRGYKKYIEDSNYDDITWCSNGRGVAKKVTEDAMGKITYKF
jgi:hypothetical protein